jgi:hypothetical protein
MRYFIKQHIHSCFASWSSGDVHVSKEITKEEFGKLPVSEGSVIVSKKHKFSVFYPKSDDKYGTTAYIRNSVSKEILQNYVQEAYLTKGYQIENEFLDAALRQHWDDENKKQAQKRKADGYVIPAWSKDLLPESYQGGFTDEIFFNPELFDYVKAGGCFGYIGHSVRKPALDAYFEQAFLSVNSDKSLLAMWLTSTGGRHFCDSLEGYTLEEQQQYIDKNIQSVIEQAIGYREKEAVNAN